MKKKAWHYGCLFCRTGAEVTIVSRIAGVELQHDKTLDEQLAAAAQREKLQKEIAKLEKLARAEKQPKRKFELVQRMRLIQEHIRRL